MQQQQLHEHMQANMLSIGQMTQNGDNYLKDGHLMLPERHRIRIDVPPSLGVRSLVINIVAAVLTLMHASTPVRTGVRVVATSWKPSIISIIVDRRLVAQWVEGTVYALSTLKSGVRYLPTLVCCSHSLPYSLHFFFSLCCCIYE